MGRGGIQGLLPPEEAHRNTEPNYTGPEDVEIYEDEEGWSFESGLAGVKEHFGWFPFVSQFPDALAGSWTTSWQTGGVCRVIFLSRSFWQRDIKHCLTKYACHYGAR